MAAAAPRSLYFSCWAMVFYSSVIHTRCRALQLAGRAILLLFFMLRVRRQFSRALAAAAAMAAGLAALLGPALALLAATLAAAVTVLAAVKLGPDDSLGHRAGAEGYDGPHCENSLQALTALASRDASGDFSGCSFPYIEVDVQECADGSLVLLHDLDLSRAFPLQAAENVGRVAAIEAATGLSLAAAAVQDLELAQLQSLALGGRRGVRAPTLRQFFEACVACDVGRPLAIEVKLLLTDAARRQLLDDISWYLETHAAALDARPELAARKHPHLGWAGLISFPHYFARAFGEYGSAQWRRWALEMHTRGIAARCCHATFLSLIYTS